MGDTILGICDIMSICQFGSVTLCHAANLAVILRKKNGTPPVAFHFDNLVVSEKDSIFAPVLINV